MIQPEESNHAHPRNSRGVFLVLVASVALTLGCVRVDSGHAGVKWTWTGGTVEDVYGEGVHIMPPWQNMTIYNTRIQDHVENLHVLASNGLSVGMETSVRYRVIINQLPDLHQQIGPEYYSQIIQPTVRSEAREVVARYLPEEIYSTKRGEVGTAIYEAIASQLTDKHVQLDKLLIRNVDLPDKIKIAISEKLEEEQKAQKMKYTLDRERKEAERKSIEAQGISDFQRIVSQGLSEGLLRWKGIEATRDLAQSQNSKVVVIGSGKDGLPIILGNQH